MHSLGCSRQAKGWRVRLLSHGIDAGRDADYEQRATVRSIPLKALRRSPVRVCARQGIMTHRELLCVLFVPALAAETEQCQSLAGLKLPETTITAAERIAAGEMPQTLLPPQPSQFSRLPALCRITAVIRPAADSEINMRFSPPLVVNDSYS